MTIGSFSMNFRGGLGNFAGNFIEKHVKSSIIPEVKSRFEGRACNVLLGTGFASKLNSLMSQAEQMDKKLNLRDFELDYSLSDDPVIKSDSIRTRHVGDMRHKANNATPFGPAPLGENYLWIYRISTL